MASFSLERIGRKNAVVFGLLVQIMATLGFGSLTLIPASKAPECDTHDLFFLLAMTARVIQGMADAFVITTCFSVVAIEFPVYTERYVGYIEIAYGLGWMLGPLLGFVLMQIFNSVMYAFYAQGVLLAIGLLFVLFTFPSHLN